MLKPHGSGRIQKDSDEFRLMKLQGDVQSTLNCAQFGKSNVNVSPISAARKRVAACLNALRGCRTEKPRTLVGTAKFSWGWRILIITNITMNHNDQTCLSFQPSWWVPVHTSLFHIASAIAAPRRLGNEPFGISIEQTHRHLSWHCSTASLPRQNFNWLYTRDLGTRFSGDSVSIGSGWIYLFSR